MPCLKPKDSNSSVMRERSCPIRSLIHRRQRRGGEVAGVDAVRQRRDVRQHLAFELDGFLQRDRVAGERMPPPCFGKALDQRQRLRFKKDHPEVGTLAAAKRLGNLRQLCKASRCCVRRWQSRCARGLRASDSRPEAAGMASGRLSTQ